MRVLHFFKTYLPDSVGGIEARDQAVRLLLGIRDGQEADIVAACD